jgi:hypothetical protein
LPATTTISESLSLTATVGVTATDAVSITKRGATRTSTLQTTVTPTWQCVEPDALLAVFEPYNSAEVEVALSPFDITNGTEVTVQLPPLAGITAEHLHVPWFEAWEAAAYLSPVIISNPLGFLDHLGNRLGATVWFPDGIGFPKDVDGSSSGGGRVTAVLRLPPLPDFAIYSTEVVRVKIPLSFLTLGELCDRRDGGNKTTPANAAPTEAVWITYVAVTPSGDGYLSSAQQVLTPFAAAMTAAAPFASPDLQTIMVLSMMPCASSYQRRTFAMFRALSVFTLDDTYEGVLWGNLIANVCGFGLHAVVVGLVSLVRKVSLGQATLIARFPSVYFQLLWQLTFASNAFASIQLLTDTTGGVGSSSKALAGCILATFCILIPLGIVGYVLRFVEASYFRYEYHKWRRGETGLRVRLLSTILLPIGRWEPQEVRRRLGPLVTLQCRPEFCWILLPVVSPALVAILSSIRGLSDTQCLWVYIILVLLHAALMIVIVLLKPLRSMIEDWFAAGGYGITMLYLVCTVMNLMHPRWTALQSVMAVLVIAQVVLLLTRMVYHVAHIFIARRLSDHVPSQLAFQWNFGTSLVEDDYNNPDEEELEEQNRKGGDGSASKDLHRQLRELMLMDSNSFMEDDEDGLLQAAVTSEEKEASYYPALSLPPSDGKDRPRSGQGEDEADDFLSGLLSSSRR